MPLCIYRIEINNCLFDYQLGLRNDHSTNPAHNSTTEKIRKGLDDGICACGFSRLSKGLTLSIMTYCFQTLNTMQ